MTRIVALTTLAAVGLGASAAQSQTVNRWVQYGPNNTVLARAITTATACPSLSVDGTAVTMNARSTPTATFPVLECEAQVGLGHTAAVIDGVQLKLPTPNPRRIVVVGDTGCRLKTTSIQACNDPAAFPLARISNYVASFLPDLIVHVGDYYYRESCTPTAATLPCPVGTSLGDNWNSWNQDWFTPAQAMMTSAPLALLRGNHESCARGQVGWFTLLDPSAFAAAAVGCTAGSSYDFTTPYLVKVGQASLLMFDSSFANDSTVTASDVSNYQAQLSAIQPSLTQNTIFVSHKPSYGLISTAGNGTSQTTSGGDVDEQALFANGVPQPIKLLLSGHVHNFQAVKLSNPAYAPQMVVGNSGTLLDPQYVAATTPGSTYSMPGAGTASTVVGTSDTSEFGFAVLDLIAGGYVANLYDVNGLPHGRCVVQLSTRNLACTN